MIVMPQRSLSIRSAPYARLIKRVVLGPGTPKSASFREEILCPEETTLTQPPIYLPGQLDRVTGATEHQPVQAEIASMLAPKYKHAATIAYHIKDAVLFDGSVYAGNLRHFIADKALFSPSSEPRHLKAAGLASTTVGTRYFGHWLRDDCVQYLLAEQVGTPICVSNPASEHKRKYAAYFGQDWTPTDRAFIDDLIIYQDFAQNSLKHRRYLALTKLIRSKFPPRNRDKLVYLRRGQTGVSRPVRDEPALLEILVKRGFVIIDVASDDLDHILTTLTQAKLVVSVEGSQITHCCYTLEPGCGLVTLQPPDRFTAIHRHWTECVGVTFGFVVGVSSDFGYHFESDEILRTVDQLLNQIERK
jgi:Glycosyltransferase 61